MNLTKHWAATLDDYVIDLAWSPAGAHLAAASAAGPVSLLAAADGALHHELPGHENGTNCIAWQPVGRVIADPLPSATEGERRVGDNPPHLLATGGQDGAVKLWDATAGQHIATATLGTAWVEHLAWKLGRVISDAPFSGTDTERNPSYLFAAGEKSLNAMRTDGAVAHAFKPAPKAISAIAAQPAGGCVAVAYFGGVSLWDADDFVVQKQFPYGNGIHALVWSPDSKWLVSGNQDPSVHLWKPEEDIELHMSGYETKVKHLSFDHTSRWLATGGGRDACIWDCSGAGPEGRDPAMLPHEAPVCAVAFQNAHGLLATASADGVVRVWSPERKQPLRATVKMPVAATKLAWSPDDRLLAIGTEKGAIYVLKSEA
ncbi:MAG: WD40 repeat domain-containing protein [Opitutaceae bacterium]